MSNTVRMSYWDLDFIDDHIKNGVIDEDPRPFDHHVNVYEIDRCYGGPEEGDWYYDRGTLVSDDLFPNLELAIEYAKKVQKELKSSAELPYKMGTGPNDGLDPNGDPDDNYIERGGSWGTGSYQINVERKVGADYPTETPRWD